MAEAFRELRVYQTSYRLAMKLFGLSREFPVEERYALTGQIRRSSRSVCANIAEGYRKRQYPAHFLSKLSDADAEMAETLVHLDFARDCGYLGSEVHAELMAGYSEVGRMVGAMMAHPEEFRPRSR